jgi:hypothetical protein
MRTFLTFFLSLTFLGGCAAPAPQKAQHLSRPTFVESVTPLPDGNKEIVVSGQFSAASNGGKVQSVNLRERLEQAAKIECDGGQYQLTPSSGTGVGSGKEGSLKLTLKGIVHCG